MCYSCELSEARAADKKVDARQIIVDWRYNEAIARPNEASGSKCDILNMRVEKKVFVNSQTCEALNLFAGRAKSARPAPTCNERALNLRTNYLQMLTRSHLIVGAQKKTVFGPAS